MTSFKALYKTPVPSVEFEGDSYLCDDAILYAYARDGDVIRSGIRFKGVAAIRTRAERCCKAAHIDGVYDTLSEIENSAWAAEIFADTQKHWQSHWRMRHFIIYLDSSGCFEIIADDWEILPEEKGAWPQIKL